MNRCLVTILVGAVVAWSDATRAAEPGAAGSRFSVREVEAAFKDSLMMRTAEQMVMGMPAESVASGPDKVFLVVSGIFTPTAEPKAALSTSEITLESPIRDAAGQWSVQTFALDNPGIVGRDGCHLSDMKKDAGITLIPVSDDASVAIVAPDASAGKPETTFVFEGAMRMCLAFRVPRGVQAAYSLNFAGNRTGLVPTAPSSTP